MVKYNKKEPWRIVLAILSGLFIVFMWVKKDLFNIYATMPKEKAIPLMVTTAAVSLLKMGGIAALVFLAKWLIGKLNR